MSKKVAIVGFAPSTRHLAPYNKEDWEVWVLNEYFSILPNGGASNITRWFELHHRETVLNSSRSENYIEHLKNSKIPVYMCKKYEDIPMSVEYPLEDIKNKLQTDYFTNSISYMIAMAVYEGYDEISIYGVDMAQEEEYAKERPSVEYFVGYARAKGIPVYIPPESDICKIPYLYGFEEESASKTCRTIDPKRKDLINRINNADFTVDEMLEHIDFKLKKYIFEMLPLVNKIKEADEKLMNLQKELNEALEVEKKVEIQKQIMEISTNAPQPCAVLYPLHDLLMAIWENNQALKSSKKERLYLAGAENISTHLRTILCPFD